MRIPSSIAIFYVKIIMFSIIYLADCVFVFVPSSIVIHYFLILILSIIYFAECVCEFVASSTIILYFIIYFGYLLCRLCVRIFCI